ncbi:hypothetical protein BB560_005636 [Smittium megazygosporum]|uniref:Uncharacterized protein n=1 Tax=Smittium megazygosporum TaxID=133381 RepID=A0A2T9Z274_9FUNG|nr:hypothetical protein BB560_005636 [Smittium megazygosporum]
MENIAADIEERRKRIREEKDLLEVTSDSLPDTSRGLNKRSLRHRGHDVATASNNKPNASAARKKQSHVILLPPLPEEDIISDLVEIRKATGVDGPLALPNITKKGFKAGKR